MTKDPCRRYPFCTSVFGRRDPPSSNRQKRERKKNDVSSSEFFLASQWRLGSFSFYGRFTQEKENSEVFFFFLLSPFYAATAFGRN